ncbi:hypothetical protein [Gryllotalpicola ginsengisoli]|uniref:hypothetical protein n=1 Tax=Gryllotalpicola ginsengisoli TaxID=444608 RepID=UPI0003B44893|nr:hypothetical protein [Gryllotalpicola ginsengisoli]
MTTTPTKKRGANLLFDLRTVIAILFAVYGIVCLIWGLAFTGQDELDKAGGYNVNLITGIGMLVLSALFVWWTLAKPLDEETEPHPETVEAPADVNPKR